MRSWAASPPAASAGAAGSRSAISLATAGREFATRRRRRATASRAECRDVPRHCRGRRPGLAAVARRSPRLASGNAFGRRRGVGPLGGCRDQLVVGVPAASTAPPAPAAWSPTAIRRKRRCRQRRQLRMVQTRGAVQRLLQRASAAALVGCSRGSTSTRALAVVSSSASQAIVRSLLPSRRNRCIPPKRGVAVPGWRTHAPPARSRQVGSTIASIENGPRVRRSLEQHSGVVPIPQDLGEKTDVPKFRRMRTNAFVSCR